SLTLEGRGSVDIDMVSLLPKSAFGASWLSGGLRADLVEALRALSPRFIRFPGGCVAEGSYFKANAYNWKDTIGAPETRRENENTWGYMQSYGLGFDEYFRLCEELNAEPLPVVHASTLCQARGSQDAPYTETEKESHIQDVLDLIEYANGDETTAYGALRAKNGHPAPYNMKFIAIGNENWGDEYFYRYGEIRAAVKAKYPEIECVVAAGPVASGALIEHSLAVIRSRYPNDIADEHYYMDSGWFLRNTSRYDAYSRNGNSIFLGEFAAHEPAVGGRRPNNMYSAVCEAAYLTGIERNADLVKMCCYAPLFARNGFTQWTPNLIWFDARSVVKTPNYYAFMMFSNAVGDRYIPANADLPDTVYSSVTASDEKVYIKLVNAGNAGEDITVSLPLTDRRALVQTLSGKAGDQNSFDVPDRLKPAETYVELVGGKITVTLPAMGILVLTCEK
ncbi:MAG: alpha-L-arabinofuranosidase C-terminal domain-containing protein, partial [Eubacteriales bacterium]|nr:alpha-L-arabinofuranosidase C-terminal domain-containing protein [Eubacteriales bacterium]